MTVLRSDLARAAERGILQHSQVEPLLAFLQEREAVKGPRFTGTNVLYYLGGLIMMAAASLFATTAVVALGMQVLFVLASFYAVCALYMAAWLEKRELATPAGLMAALAVTLVPLAVFGLQHMLGLWPADPAGDQWGSTQSYRNYHAFIDWRWMTMELATLAAGALALRRFCYPILVLPLAVTIWYMGMDFADWAAYKSGGAATWDLRRNVSIFYGLIVLLAAFFVDLRARFSRDYAFWLYLFGLMTFWGGVTSLDSELLMGKLVYLALNLLLVVVGTILRRRVFAVFGGMGITLVLGDLAWDMFVNSLGFMLVLTLFGLGLIALGVWWSKHEAELSQSLRALLPQDLRELIESRR